MSLINQMLQDLEKRRASSAERGGLPSHVRVLPAEESALSWWLLGIAAAVALSALLAWQLNLQQPTPPTPPAPVARISPVASPPAAVLPPVQDSSASNASTDSQPPANTSAPAPAAETQPSANISSPAPAAASGAPAIPASRLALELESAPSAATNPAASLPVEPNAAATKPAPEPAPAKAVVKMTRPPAAVRVAATTQASTKLPLSTATVIAGEPATPKAEPGLAVVPAIDINKLAPTAAAPAKPAVPMVSAGDSGAGTKTQVALANSQIDKRIKQLTPSQLAENEYTEAANWLSQGRLAEAQEGFRRALQHNPSHIGARQGLFGLLIEAKRNGEAEQVLHEGLKLNPNQQVFAMALSGIQYERGDTTGAIETLQRTAPAAQNSPDYLARLAALLQRQSRNAEAVEQYQAALRLAPGSGVWLMGLGISLQALNRSREAQDAFHRAKATNTLNADLQAFVDQRLRQLQ